MPDAPAPTGDGSGTQDPPTPKTTTEVLGPDGKPLDPARAAQAIERLKGEAGKVGTLEQQLADTQAQLKTLQDAQLSKEEQLTNRNTELEGRTIELENRVQELLIGSSLRDAAEKAGAKYPDAVSKLVSLSSVEFDKDGTPKNLEKVIEAVAKSYPDMFTPTQPGRVAAGPRTPAAGRDFNQMIRESAGRG